MSKEITTQTIKTTVHEWAPGLKDFALVEFNQQNFFKSAIMAIQESDQLIECMKTPAGRESLYNAMKRAFSTGLSLNPQEGKAAIVAYNGKATYQIMKEGAIEIVLRSGEIKSLMVEMVCANDEFEIEKTSDGDKFSFKPARSNRGEIEGYFCSITDNKNISHIKYMTTEECLEIRDASSTAHKFMKDNSPWAKFEKGMCKKTVIKAAIRDLHISPAAKAQFSSEDLSFQDNEPKFKDVTPPKKTGSTADDVTKKLTAEQNTTQAPENQKVEIARQNEDPDPQDQF